MTQSLGGDSEKSVKHLLQARQARAGGFARKGATKNSANGW
jgi:hypothetical protein